MRLNKHFPSSLLSLGIKSLLSNENILAFFKNFCVKSHLACGCVESQGVTSIKMWTF